MHSWACGSSNQYMLLVAAPLLGAERDCQNQVTELEGKMKNIKEKAERVEEALESEHCSMLSAVD